MAGQQVSKVKLSRQHFGGRPIITKLCATPAGAVLVAIDMSKNRQEVLIERPEGGRRRRMTVMATKENYDAFAEQLAAIGRPIVVGFEALATITGSAVATTGSPKTSPHSAKPRLDVRIMAPFSYRALTSWKNRLPPPGVTGR